MIAARSLIGDFARVVAAIELGSVAANERPAHVMRGADHAALEDRGEVLDLVRMLAAPADQLFGETQGKQLMGVLVSKSRPIA